MELFNSRWRCHNFFTKLYGTIGPPKIRWEMQKKPEDYKKISPFTAKFTNNALRTPGTLSQNSLIENAHRRGIEEEMGGAFEKFSWHAICMRQFGVI